MTEARESKESQLLGNIILTMIMLGLMILSYTLYDHMRSLKMDHKQDLEEMAVKLEKSSEKQLTYKQRLLLVSHPATQKILLKGTDNAPESYATLMYNPQLKKILVDASGMEDPMEGMDYQLWVKVKQNYISLGVIDIDQDLISIEPFVSDVKSCILSLQIEGGDEYPDLDYIYVSGKMK